MRPHPRSMRRYERCSSPVQIAKMHLVRPQRFYANLRYTAQVVYTLVTMCFANNTGHAIETVLTCICNDKFTTQQHHFTFTCLPSQTTGRIRPNG